MKKSFTLIELIVSIAIFGLVLTFLYSTLNNLHNSNLFYQQKKTDFEEKEKTLNLLYLDISQAEAIEILNPLDRKYVRLLIKNTKNSLHSPSSCNVLWFVNTTDLSLVRIESFETIKNSGVFQGNEALQIDILETKSEIFKVLKHPNGGYIVYLKVENKEPISCFIHNPY